MLLILQIAVISHDEQNGAHMIGNYTLLERLSTLSDDILVGIEEVAEITGFARLAVQQRKIKGFPRPITGAHRFKWQLSNIRAWIRARTQPEQGPMQRNERAWA